MRVEYVEKLNITNDKSISRFQDFFGRTVRNKDGSLLNGEIKLNIYPYPSIRFYNGMIDGNLYDDDGNIIERYPAISFWRHIAPVLEYWTRGYPDGNPAIIDDFNEYKEYWIDSKLVKIVEKLEYYTDEIYNGYGVPIELWENDIEDENDIESKLWLELDREEEYGQITYEKIFIEKHKQPIIANDDFFYKKDLDSYTEKDIDDILSFDNNLSFQNRLLEIMNKKHLRDPQVYREIGMDERNFNKIKNAKPDASISYDNAVMIAFGLKLTFEQMVKFVNLAGKGFRNHSERDKLVRRYFETKKYSVYDLNLEIYDMNKIRDENKKIKLFLQERENQTESSNKETSTKKKYDKKSSKKNKINQK